MDLVPGEYEFECDECNGDGNVQVIREDDQAPDGCSLFWDQCDDCRGQGTVTMDEDEAAEAIEVSGRTPIRTPAAT
ncbi:hypothetical protein ACFVZD_41435 [Streptomyces sp. NPDC058287]|uniref:hypothetical protein n=1 Tax=Streptomyces sp. NPDC058287 TaxID=3346423 RepID=UPI0036E2C72B